jgi:hypothetical protein
MQLKCLTAYDNTCRFLAEHFSADFASWLLGEPAHNYPPQAAKGQYCTEAENWAPHPSRKPLPQPQGIELK